MKRTLLTVVFFPLVLGTNHLLCAQTVSSSPEPSAVAKAVVNGSHKSADPEETTVERALGGGSEARRYYASGSALLDSGKIDDAIRAFKQAARLSPNDPQNHYMLGMAHSKAKGYKDSFESFKRAVKFKEDWAEAHFRLGILSYVLGKKTQSIDSYNNLLRLDSPLANTLYRVIKDEKQLAVAETLTSGNWSLHQSQVIKASVPVKETSTPVVKESPPDGNSTSTTVNLAPAAVDSAPVSNDPAPIAEDQKLTGIYKIGVGDILDIRLLNSSTSRSTLYTVIDGGMIDLPVAGGAMVVAGLTTDEIQALIAAELKRRAVEEGARVSVGVRQYTSHSVVITGLVINPGLKFLRREAVPLYVIMAEAQARLDAGRVTIMRSGLAALNVDLAQPDALNFLVRPGDTITVAARPQQYYYIAGRINYPGQKIFQADITLVQAILAAGGPIRPGDNVVEISREGKDGRLTTTEFRLKEIKGGRIQDPRLQPGDRIEVIR
jgi:protein involved in polysaccharide export with SLBB domain